MKNDFSKQFEQFGQFAEMMKAAIPTVKTNANGYEIRTSVLEFAQNQAWNDYHAKWGQFETTIERTSDGKIVTTVNMPEVPGVDTVLETANKFYEFINNNSK